MESQQLETVQDQSMQDQTLKGAKKQKRNVWMIIAFILAISLGGCIVSGTKQSSAIKFEKLAETDDIRSSGEQNFSISPTGQWILYYSEKGNPFNPVYVLYNLEREMPHELELSPRAQTLSAEGRGPLQRAGCWDEDGTHVYLPGDGILFVTDVQAARLQWEVVEDVDKQAFLNYYECSRQSSEMASNIQIVQISDREVQIVEAQNPNQILARHTAQSPTATRVDVQYPVISPNAKYLTYVVTEYTGSFVGASRGYLLNLAVSKEVKPRFLIDSVLGPLRWSPDSKTVYVPIRNGRSGKGIYQWEVDDEN